MKKEWERKARFYAKNLANLYCSITKEERTDIQNTLNEIAKLAQENKEEYQELYSTYLYLYMMILSNQWEKKYQDEIPVYSKDAWGDMASNLWLKNGEFYLKQYDPDLSKFTTYLQNCIKLEQIKRELASKEASSLSGHATGSQHHAHIYKAIKDVEAMYPNETIGEQIRLATKMYRSADYHGKQIVKNRISHMKDSEKYAEFIKNYSSVEEAEEALGQILQAEIDSEDINDRGFDGSYEAVSDYYYNIYLRKEQSLDVENAQEIASEYDIDAMNSTTVIMDLCEYLLLYKDDIPRTYRKNIVDCAKSCYGYFIYDTNEIDDRSEMTSFKGRKQLAQAHPFTLGEVEIPNNINTKVIKSTIVILQLGVLTEYFWCHETECPKVVEMLDRAEEGLLPKKQQEAYDKVFKNTTYPDSLIKILQNKVLKKEPDFSWYLLDKQRKN